MRGTLKTPMERRTNKWFIHEPQSNFGYPVGEITITLPARDDRPSLQIKGYATDCDGDGSSWSVYENGENVASGDVDAFYDETKDPRSDFDQAVIEASRYIMTGVKPCSKS